MSTTNKIKILTIIFFLTAAVQGDAQRKRKQKLPDNRFELSVLTGINLSQIDGDYFTGFDQSGLNAGIQVDAIMAPRLRLSVGMMYSQKGAMIPHGVVLSSNPKNDRQVRLNYIEIPILFKFMLNQAHSGAFLEVGASLARLSSTQIIEREAFISKGTIYNDISNEFDKADANAVFGIGFTIGKRFSLVMRYNYGLTKFYNNQNFELPAQFSTQVKEVEFLRNYNMSIMGAYRIL